MSCSINWCGLTWEAAATLMTGALAVGGAVFIGLRQNKILGSQNNVERLRLKSELFDKRYRIFVEFGVFLDHAAVGSPELPNLIEAMRQNLERSIFLFDKGVYDHLLPLFQQGQLQAVAIDATRSTALHLARQNLYKTFESWLKLDDSML